MCFHVFKGKSPLPTSCWQWALSFEHMETHCIYMCSKERAHCQQVEVPADQLYQNIITARKIVETSKKEICLTCFSDLAKENDLFVNILPSFNNTYIYDIKDSNYIINNEQYHLRFAIQYES